MNLSEKLQLLRKKNGFSQEELADRLGISRQAISKWESGQSIPDLNKLITLSELYNVTVDSLVKDSDEYEILQSTNKDNKEQQDNKNTQIIINLNKNSMEYEYKSNKTLLGLPLIHINIGRGIRKAKGVIAIGNISYGIISLGFLSIGAISFGLMSIGLFSLAILSIALILAVGTISIGIFSIGAISIGVFSLGALSIGKFAIGASAIGTDIAVGDYAKANIAIGNKVNGIKSLPLSSTREEIERIIRSEYPNLKEWIINIINYFSGIVSKGNNFTKI
ncbi:helix-turn-helix domain-containing protein [Clostridium nigeriense]|uniref:helix-turn-helix domain-containing protein n=1 Tax=Clostridium nigeriense TaxID=1805470 RepID=UPI000829D318|nr:helix-turn-helix transcriptional regulator [Clostridium nigeriense]